MSYSSRDRRPLLAHGVRRGGVGHDPGRRWENVMELSRSVPGIRVTRPVLYTGMSFFFDQLAARRELPSGGHSMHPVLDSRLGLAEMVQG